MRRWQNFGRSGAKLIWGGEAVAVRHDGRANPNQLVINEDTPRRPRPPARDARRRPSRRPPARDDGPAGRPATDPFRPLLPAERQGPARAEDPLPPSAARPPIRASAGLSGADRRRDPPAHRGLPSRGASWPATPAFDFVDVKHCHGYLGHEFLSAHDRAGDYGGSFENRTRFLREIVAGIRADRARPRASACGCRAFDMVPFQPDPALRSRAQPGPGVPELSPESLPIAGASA